MKIGIFGGTFDPVHNEHIAICKAALEELGLDRLIVIPAGNPPHKEVLMENKGHRFEMAKLAFTSLPQAEISDYELFKEEKNYSYQTLEHFKSLYQEDELFFIVGADSLIDMLTKWKKPEIIAQLCTVAVVQRGGVDAPEIAMEHYQKTYGKSVRKLCFWGKQISSTEVKVLLEFGISVKELIPQEVLNYIEQNNLYQKRQPFLKKACSFLSQKRFIHTAYTAAEALILARRTNCDEEKTFTAAVLHDIAKKLTRDQLSLYGYHPPEDMAEPVVHAFAGAYLAEKEFGITDSDILHAIRYHTTGRPNMSLLEKVIYTADCIEKTRDYEGVEGLRKEVEKDFESGFVACLKGTIDILKLENRKQVSELTRAAYEYYQSKTLKSMEE